MTIKVAGSDTVLRLDSPCLKEIEDGTLTDYQLEAARLILTFLVPDKMLESGEVSGDDLILRLEQLKSSYDEILGMRTR